ncbi:purine-nucleoside phosphorylase [Alienimonas chondri]|uniref:Purine nucleoside phosphorylase n=1 Tax=Alienimonas chondri TaxID=2681879 RepID=A0ABX1VDZ5_9PLAN|nr:purine-nucleoside phosphorylase [Alienimonas chondri]NNJ25730.1 Purine nucleoside phosphorylase 1 [Alienimonas chondri]
MNDLKSKIEAAADAVRSICDRTPRVAVVTGTGLGGLAEAVNAEAVIPYAEIPHFPPPTAPSHRGRLLLGELNGASVAVLDGRFHSYEGYTLAECTFPIRVVRALGAETLVLTNAAGGLNPSFELADTMLIEDHIDFLSGNPLTGPNDDSLGPRFPDMYEPYDRGLMAIAREEASAGGMTLRDGVFVAVPGPNLETRAEYRMLRGFGADVVGMSTVPECIVAKHCGMKTLAFSVVTDLCDPERLEPVDIAKIIATAERGGAALSKLLQRVIPRL